MQIIFIRVHKLIVQSDLSLNSQLPSSIYWQFLTTLKLSATHLHLSWTLQPPVQLTYIYQEPYSP